jgi:proteasome accessory factor A
MSLPECIPRCVPKLCGADIELGNFIPDSLDLSSSVREASQALLAEITAEAGVSAASKTVDLQDRERAFLWTNGGSAYIDLDHLEICQPEMLSAFDHVACWHAMLRMVQTAQTAASARRQDGRRIQVLANNSDGRGNSYGSHLNFLVSRSAWDNVVHRKPHHLAYLAAFQVSSLPFSGQGKVGSENGAPPVDYQLSQRADFFETIAGMQTTFHRPLVNTRDEPHCGGLLGSRTELARAHVIFYDSTLCPVSRVLTVGATQIVLALLEAGRVAADLALEDPLAALQVWSHDPTLEARAPLVSGEAVTAVQLQRRFLDQAQGFVAAGGCDGIVPRAREIVALWDDTLTRLDARDWATLSGRLDWVLKRALLERARRRNPDLSWDSPEIKHLDHLYSSLDPSEGLFWRLAERGLIQPVVSDALIHYFQSEPPRETRAWGRAMLLRRARTEWIEQVEWDGIRFRVPEPDGSGHSSWRVDLSNPFGATCAELEETLATSPSFDVLLRAVGATRERPPAITLPPVVWSPLSSWNDPGNSYWKGGRHGSA